MAFRLEDLTQSREDRQTEFSKLGPAVVDNRLIHCAQDAIRNVCRTWNLKEVTACMNHFPLEKRSNPIVFYITSPVAASARCCTGDEPYWPERGTARPYPIETGSVTMRNPWQK